MNILCVCGARPNFMKIAPLSRAFAARPGLDSFIVHTGQHYDDAMNRLFFDELAIPRPEVNLEVGSGSHARQTALVMQRFEPIVLERKPDAVLVVGDVNSTMACALVAVKLHVPVIHVEAGLRSFDRTMPEEINRVVTDSISDLLFVSEKAGVENLRREGIAESKIHFAGNVMIDTLRTHLQAAEKSNILERLKVSAGGFAVLTLHRPSNADDAGVLRGICDALRKIQERHPIVFPVHPRTRANFERTGIGRDLASMPNLRLTEPLGYLDFLRLLSQAAFVMTDSGGIQEETTALGVPCMTLRSNTERPATIEQGTNRLVGSDPACIMEAYGTMADAKKNATIPDLWDGHASDRIADALLEWGRRKAH